jgi:hypothetical protein
MKGAGGHSPTVKNAEIHIRDPFVLPIAETGEYFLFGTTGANCWSGPGSASGFDCFRGRDLTEWGGPIPAFRPPQGFWATVQFWAPEVHRFGDAYYMFASFKAPERYRGTQILRAERPEGPYLPISDGPITPPDWECLDGTFHVAQDGTPWIVFCHEWTQVCNGSVCAMPLSRDLARPVGRPVFLFNATEAPWVRSVVHPDRERTYPFPCTVTDGPFLFRTRTGRLLMLWSSQGEQGYTMGIARSESGTVLGPWVQQPDPIWARDGGHGMIFRAHDGRLLLTLHAPNNTPEERPVFVEIEDRGDTVAVASGDGLSRQVD